MHRQAISVIRDSVRLQEPIHNAAFRDQQGKKTIFSQALAMQQLIVVNDITVDGIILTKRALIHPTIGKNKIIFCKDTSSGYPFLYFCHFEHREKSLSFLPLIF